MKIIAIPVRLGEAYAEGADAIIAALGEIQASDGPVELWYGSEAIEFWPEHRHEVPLRGGDGVQSLFEGAALTDADVGLNFTSDLPQPPCGHGRSDLLYVDVDGRLRLIFVDPQGGSIYEQQGKLSAGFVADLKNAVLQTAA
jgi:hypothetical protein